MAKPKKIKKKKKKPAPVKKKDMKEKAKQMRVAEGKTFKEAAPTPKKEDTKYTKKLKKLIDARTQARIDKSASFIEKKFDPDTLRGAGLKEALSRREGNRLYKSVLKKLEEDKRDSITDGEIMGLFFAFFVFIWPNTFKLKGQKQRKDEFRDVSKKGIAYMKRRGKNIHYLSTIKDFQKFRKKMKSIAGRGMNPAFKEYFDKIKRKTK